MRKTLSAFAIAVLMLVSVAAGAAENLLNFVPEKANVMIYLKFNEIVSHPALKDARDKNMELSSRYNEIESKLSKFNIKMEELAGDMVVFSEGDDDAGAVLKTGITEQKLKEMIASGVFSEKNDGKIEEATMAGRKVFILSSPVKNEDMLGARYQLDNQAVITYLNKNTLLITEKNCFEKISGEIAKSNVLANKKLVDFKKNVNPDATMWAVFSIPEKAKKQSEAQAPQQMPVMANPAESIRGGSVSVTLSGKDKSDIALEASLECDDEQSASMMAMQAQGLIMLGSGIGH